jgi:integrase
VFIKEGIMAVYQRKGRKGWYMDFIFQGVRIFRLAGRTNEEAKETEEILKKRLRLTMLDGIDEEIPFGYVANEYLEYVEDTKSKRTYKLEYGDYENHLKPFFSKYMIDAIDKNVLLEFQRRKKRQGYANRTVNIHIGLVRKIIHYAIDKNYMYEKPLKYPMLREAKKLHSFLTPEEYLKLTQTISYSMAIQRVRFAKQTGMRPAELTYLSWRDIDFELKTAKVQGKKEWKPKTDEERIIPLNKTALDILKELYSRRKGKWVFSSNDKPVKSIRRSLDTAAKKAGISKKVTPNMLRHTFATHVLMAGGDVKSVMELLGHKSLETTNRYLHTIDENLKKTVDLIDENKGKSNVSSINEHRLKRKKKRISTKKSIKAREKAPKRF